MDSTIARPAEKIPKAAFNAVFQLALRHSWLETESDALLELWNTCDHESQQLLLGDLIDRFTSVDSKLLMKLGDLIAIHIVKSWGFKPDNTLIVATSDKDKPDGAQALLQSLKDKFASFDDPWTEDNFKNSIGAGEYNAVANSNVVLVDDFIGTGRTIARKVKWLDDSLKSRDCKGVRVNVCALAAMEASKKKLSKLDVEYYAPVWLTKGITDYFKGAQLSAAIADMKQLELALHPTVNNRELKTFAFGFGQSESLFRLEAYNTPNNVFPIFWWPRDAGNNKRKTLLRRLSP